MNATTDTIEEALARFKAIPVSEWLGAARTVLEVRAVLTLRGLPDEAYHVGTVGHVERNRRFSALAQYAAVRDDEAKRLVERCALGVGLGGQGMNTVPCGAVCIWTGPGPCSCRAPEALQKLRRRQRAILWANRALLRE